MSIIWSRCRVSGTLFTDQSEATEGQRRFEQDVPGASILPRLQVHNSFFATPLRTPMAFWDTVLSTTNAKSYGRRLIPNIVDDNARQQAGHVCFSYPRCYANLDYGFQDVNWRQVSIIHRCLAGGADSCKFANAVNKMAHFLQRHVGADEVSNTFVYMGFPDLRTYMVLVAA